MEKQPDDSTIDHQTFQNEKDSKESGNPHVTNEWTAGRVAALILLIAVCAVLIWNAYTPEDIFFNDLKYEVMVADRLDPKDDASVEGRTLQIHDTYYPKGLGVYANSEIFLRFIPDG